MSFSKINSALVQGYIDANLGLVTAYDGVSFEPPSQEDWAQVTVVPADNSPVTLGKGGEDEELGFMQIDLRTPIGYGSASLLDYADTLQAHFIAGKGFVYDTQEVIIDSIDRANLFTEGDWLRMVISVNYRARTFRPTF